MVKVTLVTLLMVTLPDGFFGCLGCGSGTHIFREYTDQRDRAVRTVYWQELWAHVPKTRKKT